MNKIVSSALLVASFALVGCNRTPPASSGPTVTPPPVAGGNNSGSATDTPESLVATANAAQQKGDFKTFIACFTPEAQMDMAAGLASGALHQQSSAQGTGKLQEEYRIQFKPITDALDKHGLPYEQTKQFSNLLGFEPGNLEKLVQELKKMIKDPAGLYAEIQEAYSKIPPFNSHPRPPEVRVTDIKVNGDKATGTMVGQLDGMETKEPVEFVKIGGSWKIPLRAGAGSK